MMHSYTINKFCRLAHNDHIYDKITLDLTRIFQRFNDIGAMLPPPLKKLF